MIIGLSKVVTGQLFIANLSLYKPTGFSASHSFITSREAYMIDQTIEVISYLFITVTPTGEVYKSTSWCKNVPIRIEGQISYANLIFIELNDYDAILGIDGLSMCHLYCYRLPKEACATSAHPMERSSSSREPFWNSKHVNSWRVDATAIWLALSASPKKINCSQKASPR